MRHSIIIISIILGTLSFHALAENTMTFVAGNDVCTPITVNVGGNSYTVFDYITITETSGTVMATDCSGRKLKYSYEHRSSNGNSTDIYTFHNTYDVDRDSGSSGGYGYSEDYEYSSSNNNAYNLGRSLGRAIIYPRGDEGDAYPSLQLATGISRAYGENIKLRYTGHGFLAYASIGKDYLFDGEFKDKILWNVGLGSYFSFGGDLDPNMDLSLGLSVGQQAQWEKLSLMFDIGYTYWIGSWRRIGIFAGGGLGWGKFTEVFNTDDYDSHSEFAWNIEAGIIIRLANF